MLWGGRESTGGWAGTSLCVCVCMCARTRARAHGSRLCSCTCVRVCRSLNAITLAGQLRLSGRGAAGPGAGGIASCSVAEEEGAGGRAGGRAGRRAGGRAGGGPRRLPGRHRVWRFAGGVSCLPWHSAQDLWQAVQCDSLGVLLQRGIEGRRAGGDGRVGDHVSEHEFMFRACSWHQKHALCLRT